MGVLRKLGAWIEGEDEPSVELEHDHGSRGVARITRVFGSDHAGRREPESLPIEGKRPLEIVNRQGDQVNPRFHADSSPGVG
jgi:hypothetical protein